MYLPHLPPAHILPDLAFDVTGKQMAPRLCHQQPPQHRLTQVGKQGAGADKLLPPHGKTLYFTVFDVPHSVTAANVWLRALPSQIILFEHDHCSNIDCH